MYYNWLFFPPFLFPPKKGVEKKRKISQVLLVIHSMFNYNLWSFYYLLFSFHSTPEYVRKGKMCFQFPLLCQKIFYNRLTNSAVFCALHSKCLYHPFPFYEPQIISPFLTLRVEILAYRRILILLNVPLV